MCSSDLEAVQRTFRTAHDITPEWHVRMQAAYQEHVDSAISKTTNFPHEASREDVRAGFADGTFWPPNRPRFDYQEEMIR